MRGSNLYQKVYEAVRQIPEGRVVTYGRIARLIGSPRAARVVGYALHMCKDEAIPCHRVVNRYGGLAEAFCECGVNRQRLLLEAEGVEFTADGRVDMEKYLI